MQFLRQSDALVPGPVWMMYSENVISINVLEAIWHQIRSVRRMGPGLEYVEFTIDLNISRAG